MIQNYMQADPRGRIDRFWSWFGFGECANPNPWPEDMPGFAPSYLATNTIAFLSIKDHLRVLVSGKVMVAASTKTDVIVHQAVSESSISVLPPNWHG